MRTLVLSVKGQYVNVSSHPGRRLRQQRETLNLSQSEMATLCGVSREMWGKYERGVAVPGGTVLAKAAEAGIDVAYVLSGGSAAQRAAYDIIRGSTTEAMRLPGTPVEKSAFREADAQRKLQARQPVSESEGALIEDFRACSPDDQLIVSRMAATLAASKSKSAQSDASSEKSHRTKQVFKAEVGQVAGKNIINKNGRR